MPVQNIECQIAQAQIGRYLTGDQFDGEALRQLEAHVSNCADCNATLAQKKATLQAMLGGSGFVNNPAPAPKPEAPELEELNPAVAAFLERREKPLKQKKETPVKAVVQQEIEKPATPGTFWKPLMYSGALALVLIGMSVFAKNPTGLLGNKAAVPEKSTPTAEASKLVDEPKPALKTMSTIPSLNEVEPKKEETNAGAGVLPEPPTDALDQTPITKTATEEPKTEVKETEKVVEKPLAKPVVKAVPRTTVKKPVVRKTRRGGRKNTRPATTSVKPLGSGNSIRVYDSNGNPIK